MSFCVSIARVVELKPYIKSHPFRCCLPRLDQRLDILNREGIRIWDSLSIFERLFWHTMKFVNLLHKSAFIIIYHDPKRTWNCWVVWGIVFFLRYAVPYSNSISASVARVHLQLQRQTPQNDTQCFLESELSNYYIYIYIYIIYNNY